MTTKSRMWLGLAVVWIVAGVGIPRGDCAEKPGVSPGNQVGAAPKAVSWSGDRCFDAGCMTWKASTGAVWNGDQCFASGCRQWKTSAGVVWKGDRCFDAGCMEWKSSAGAAWNGQQCATGGCAKWSSSTGDDQFLPFLFGN